MSRVPNSNKREAKTEGCGCLILVGPMPPPVHGASIVMSRMVSDLAPYFARTRVFDTGGQSTATRWLRPLRKLVRSVAPIGAIYRSDTVYISVKSGNGMWLSSAVAAFSRLMGAQIFLHHHSYLYVSERKSRMIALTRGAGPGAQHIVLSHAMARDLQTVMPEIRQVTVLGNAGWVDRTLLELPLKSDKHPLVLGHLSNLSREKGIAEVVDLALALKKSGNPVRLLIGGPILDKDAQLALNRAAEELGDQFDYRGHLSGDKKRTFYQEITHFVFPSRNEALPLVLYEAMAAGAICLATRVGSIPEQLAGSPGLTARDTDSFVAEILPRLQGLSVSSGDSRSSREAYLRSLSESEQQMTELLTLLTSRDRCDRTPWS